MFKEHMLMETPIPKGRRLGMERELQTKIMSLSGIGESQKDRLTQ